MHIRVYNYNTLERVHQYEAHSDYIRSIAVHPTQTFILTSSGLSCCRVSVTLSLARLWTVPVWLLLHLNSSYCCCRVGHPSSRAWVDVKPPLLH